MSLEAYPVLHYLMALVFYNVGLMANILTAAHLGMSSKNNSIHTLKEYLKLRWIPLCVRWIVCIFVFLIGWENSALGIERILDDSLALHLGAAGFLGFGSDEFVSKVLALLGIQKDLPKVPDATQNEG